MGSFWNSNRDKQLTLFYAKGASYEDLEKIFGASTKRIKARLRALDIRLVSPRKKPIPTEQAEIQKAIEDAITARAIKIKRSINRNITLPSLSESSKGYIAGFFDGEGCFTLSYGTRKDSPTHRRFYPSAQVVITNSNITVLTRITEQMGIGGIHKINQVRTSRAPNASPIINHLTINSFTHILVFIDEMLPYLIVKKEEALVVKEALTYLINQKTSKVMHWQPEHIATFNKYILTLRSLKSCAPNRIKARINSRVVERPEIYV